MHAETSKREVLREREQGKGKEEGMRGAGESLGGREGGRERDREIREGKER